jgi:radical SAM protein with 4Fe4S-binding SPASM domain
MAARMGYENFCTGNVRKSEFNDLIDNDVVKTSCLASCLESHAGCSDCVYKPYCGICPVVNLTKYGTIFPQMSATDHCQIMMGIFDYLFVKARNSTYEPIWERWLAYSDSLQDQHSCPI